MFISKASLFVVFKLLIIIVHVCAVKLNTRKFPEDFLFGIATSAYQIEGAWNESGKGESVWDHFTHNHPEKIEDATNGDIACDSYHKIEEDVAAIKNLGVDFYRFSLSWSRILPTGFTNYVNKDALNYYNRLIDELISNDIQPMVTLYHWDLPQTLQELGGWPNPYLIEYFEDYAKIVFEHFGDRVKYWVTFNEPINICAHGYGYGIKAPGIRQEGIADYACSRTLLLAHAKVYHLYNEHYKPKHGGRIGICLSSGWPEPLTNSTDDILASETLLQASLGWFAIPIFSTGDFPEIMRNEIGAKSRAEGFPRSRLPEFNDEEKSYIKGSSDFLGFNYYTSGFATSLKNNPRADLKEYKHYGVSYFFKEDMETAASPWLKVAPWGFTKILKWLKKTFGDVDIFVTENGFSDLRGTYNDLDRINYHQLHLSALLDAIDEGVNIKAYTFWSLMDNFEWTEGFKHVFGLYSVDFRNPDLPRVPKKSVSIVKEIIKNRHLQETTIPVEEEKIINDEL